MNDVYVIGLGYVGLPIAIQASKSGYKVIGFDVDHSKVEDLKNGICEIPGIIKEDFTNLRGVGSLTFVNELPKSRDESIFIIAVPTPLDLNRNPDLTFLESACAHISKSISDNSIVINESTSYIGTLRSLIKPLIEKVSGAKNLKFAAAPERIDPGNKKWNLKNTPRIIGGISQECVDSAASFYEVFCESILKVSSPEVAEASKLLENTFRQVNIALVNEFALLSKEMNISMNEIISAASTKPFGFMEFHPGLGVGGHCIPVDPVYLSFSASINNIDLELVNLANSINQNQVSYVVNKIKQLFNENCFGKTIQIAGIAYKKNIPDVRESPALDLINKLRNLGAIVLWHDPIVLQYKAEKSMPLIQNIDLGIIITPHDGIDFKIWNQSNLKVLDLSPGNQICNWPKFF